MSQPNETVTVWENGKLVEKELEEDPWADGLVDKFIEREAAIARRAREFGLNPNDPTDCRVLLRRLANNEKPRNKPGQKVEPRLAGLIIHLADLRERKLSSPGMPTQKLGNILAAEFRGKNKTYHGFPGYKNEEAARNLLRAFKRFIQVAEAARVKIQW
jgi:hypothetical protein